MKYTKYMAAAAVLALAACQNTDLPEDAVLSAPITSLILEVSGEDYTAVPDLDDSHAFTGEMSLMVKIPNARATVKAIALRAGYTTDISVGDVITFEDSKYTVNLKNGASTEAYTVNMLFNPPPVIWAVKSSDKDEEGTRYFFNVETQDFLASANYDNIYEGELNLTKTNWDNVGLISEDLTTIYNVAAGPWPPVSYYTWTAETKAAKGDGYFSCEGPWNDWREKNGNTDIVSPGVWRVVFDSNTLFVEMTMTQWAVTGDAVTDIKAMTYDAVNEKWQISCALTAGAIHFETIPVTFGDPVYHLGYKENILGMLASDGSDIAVESAGNYDIELTLSNPPYYTYSITKK